ncbi:hypothetical protein CONCODRAFT_7970 [Conidiobolus coronatus NRRL 28638]|uniref:Uncharacterized protein n=1 Tax=Conidiobolus coronatus (strain ATCC 28846 / CBS 209.66 / NRRL 28638) TaxID=796925 RepID=A0A137P3Q0_CONC2|nr:hypothetical protein CONCODRAFT_7970 [Conidiobolus coronatus NRRL 28638]|eukprot:KXN69559.1 hypothetical protein CONCODRAFT_7970 [Conidiobolus coronatus NRRL 28638]
MRMEKKEKGQNVYTGGEKSGTMVNLPPDFNPEAGILLDSNLNQAIVSNEPVERSLTVYRNGILFGKIQFTSWNRRSVQQWQDSPCFQCCSFLSKLLYLLNSRLAVFSEQNSGVLVKDCLLMLKTILDLDIVLSGNKLSDNFIAFNENHCALFIEEKACYTEEPFLSYGLVSLKYQTYIQSEHLKIKDNVFHVGAWKEQLFKFLLSYEAKSEDEFITLVRNNLIRPVSKSWEPPHFSIRKLDGTYKIVVGYNRGDEKIIPCITPITNDISSCEEDKELEYFMIKKYRFNWEQDEG